MLPNDSTVRFSTIDNLGYFNHCQYLFVLATDYNNIYQHNNNMM